MTEDQSSPRRWRVKFEAESADDSVANKAKRLAAECRRVGSCADAHTWTIEESLYQRTLEEPPPFQADRVWVAEKQRPMKRRGGKSG